MSKKTLHLADSRDDERGKSDTPMAEQFIMIQKCVKFTAAKLKISNSLISKLSYKCRNTLYNTWCHENIRHTSSLVLCCSVAE